MNDAQSFRRSPSIADPIDMEPHLDDLRDCKSMSGIRPHLSIAEHLLQGARVSGCVGLILLGLFSSSEACAQTDKVFPSATQQDAQNDLKRLSLEELGKLEVTTFTKAPTPLRDTPAAIYVVTGEEIIRSGATNIADALRLAPGVEVGRLSSTTWAVGVRGLQSNFSKSVLVLIDGRNVYTPLFAGVYWDVLDLPLSNIDRIEVIRGPGGTIWGPNSANGVINIITKKAAESRGIEATVVAGNIAHTIDDLQYGGSFGATDFRVFGRGFQRAHEYHPDGDNEDVWHQERFGFRADRSMGHHEFLLEGDIYRGDSPHIVGTMAQYDKTSGGDVNFRYQQPHTNGSGLSVQAYFDRTLRTGAGIGETRNTIDVDIVERFKAGGPQLFSIGAGLRWSPYRVIAQNPDATLVPPTGTDHVHTGFIQDEFRLGETVNITLGAKLQQNNYSGFDIQPSARVLWSPSEHRAVWAGVSRAVTTPSDIEEKFLLQGTAAPGVIIQVLGDPHFQSENVLGYEGGYRGLVSKRVLLDFSLFRNQYTRLQSFGATTFTNSGSNSYLTIEYTNQIDGAISGFELAPQIAIGKPWRMNLAYSFLNSAFHADGATSDISSTGSVSTYEKSSPKHQLSLQSMIDLPGKVQLDQTYRYVSALPAQKVPSYQTMDVHLGRTVGRNFTLDVVGQNLFQHHHYEWGTGDPSQPLVGIYRAGYLRLSFHEAHAK